MLGGIYSSADAKSRMEARGGDDGARLVFKVDDGGQTGTDEFMEESEALDIETDGLVANPEGPPLEFGECRRGEKGVLEHEDEEGKTKFSGEVNARLVRDEIRCDSSEGEKE